jgi:hypothetical protein
MPIVTTRKSGVYHLLPDCLAHIEVRIHLLITECFVSCFLNLIFMRYSDRIKAVGCGGVSDVNSMA